MPLGLMPFPQLAILKAARDALLASSGVTQQVEDRVYVASTAPADASGDLILIPPQASSARGDIKSDTGHETSLRIRISTEHAVGHVNILAAHDLAESVQAALAGVAPDGHRLLDLPEADVTPQQYTNDDQSVEFYDLLLNFPLLTQTTA